jgi:O-antigen ligase
MPPQLALLAGVVFIIYAFRSDRQRDVGDTSGLFWPTLWYLVVSTRPVGYWLMIWNIPVLSGGGDGAEGSPIDRYFYTVLTIAGLRVLMRRRFDWGAAFRRNPWATALVVYMAASILWSHYPYVSFKRYIKIIGSVVMAFVVLSHERPLQAMCTVLRRCLYIHLPMSIICIKYFRSIGVGFDFGGATEWWNGIATTKNTLGQVLMLGVIYFFWEVRRHWALYKWKNLHFAYLAMAVLLLKGSPESTISMTSASVTLFGLLIFLRMQALRERPASVRPFVLSVFFGLAAVVIMIAVHSVSMFTPDSIFGHVITAIGKDITMTGRTDIWHDVYAAASGNPLLGVGFGGFWIGREVNIPWNANMTWVLNQAHNGYIETYLQLGLIGVFLLAGTLYSGLHKMLNSLADNFDLGCFRISVFLAIAFVNISESTYLRGDHHLWLMLQIVLWSVPLAHPIVGGGELVEEEAPLLQPEPIDVSPSP